MCAKTSGFPGRISQELLNINIPMFYANLIKAPVSEPLARLSVSPPEVKKAHAQPDTSGLGLNTEFVPSFGGKSGWHTR